MRSQKFLTKVKFMSNLDRKLISRGYVKIFLISVLFFLAGFVVTTVANIIPSINYGEFGYDDYTYLMTILSSASTLVQNLGIVLFSVAMFLGALTDESLSKEVQRALVIASGIGIVALVLFNRLILYFF